MSPRIYVRRRAVTFASPAAVLREQKSTQRYYGQNDQGTQEP